MAKLKRPLGEDYFNTPDISKSDETETTIGNVEKLTEYIEKMTTKERNEQANLNAKLSDSIVVR